MFPGQGSQRAGMFAPLRRAGPSVRRLLEEADEILGWPLSRLDGDEALLHRTENAQPALYVGCLAAWRALCESAPIEPRALLGHSLGEITALAAAGSLGFADGLRLVARRGRAMASADRSGGMVAVLGLSAERVELLLAELAASEIVIANDNAPRQVVLSGPAAELERLAPRLRQAGARLVPLKISVACHSPRMQAAAEELRPLIEALALRPPRWPVLSNVTGAPHGPPQEMRRRLLEQLTAPVRFQTCVDWALRQNVRHFIEVGPGTVLCGLVRQIDRTSRLTAYDGSGTQGAD